MATLVRSGREGEKENSAVGASDYKVCRRPLHTEKAYLALKQGEEESWKRYTSKVQEMADAAAGAGLAPRVFFWLCHELTIPTTPAPFSIQDWRCFTALTSSSDNPDQGLDDINHSHWLAT